MKLDKIITYGIFKNSDYSKNEFTFGLNDNFVGILTSNDKKHEEQKTILKQFFQLEEYPKENIMNFKGAEEELKSLITQEIRDTNSMGPAALRSAPNGSMITLRSATGLCPTGMPMT